MACTLPVSHILEEMKTSSKEHVQQGKTTSRSDQVYEPQLPRGTVYVCSCICAVFM